MVTPRSAIAVCDSSGTLFLAHGQLIYAFEIHESCHPSLLFVVQFHGMVTHVACGGSFHGHPVSAGVDEHGGVMVFYTDTAQVKVLLQSHIETPVVDFVVFESELCALIRGEGDGVWEPCGNRFVTCPLRHDAVPVTKESSISQFDPAYVRFADCYVVGRKAQTGFTCGGNVGLWLTIPGGLIVKRVLPFLGSDVLFRTIGCICASWATIVEQECRAAHREETMQFSIESDTFRMVLYPPYKSHFEINTRVDSFAGVSRLRVSPALHSAIFLCCKDALEDDRHMWVCTALRKVNTCDVRLMTLSVALPQVSGFPDSLAGDKCIGMAVLGKKVLLLCEDGFVHELALRILPDPGDDPIGPCKSFDDEAAQNIADYANTLDAVNTQVISTIEHDEPAAIIAPGEVEQIENIQHHGRIERMSTWATVVPEVRDIDNCFPEPDASDDVFLLTFNRRPEKMVAALSEGVSLRACRDNLLAAGRNFRLISGTLVFVHPDQYGCVMRA